MRPMIIIIFPHKPHISTRWLLEVARYRLFTFNFLVFNLNAASLLTQCSYSPNFAIDWKVNKFSANLLRVILTIPE